MNVKNRQQFLIMLTAAAALLYVGVNFVFTPLGNWWAARQTRVHQLREQIKDGQSMIRREAGIRSHWADMQTNALPPSLSQAEQRFLKALDGWARDSGAGITSIMPQWKNDSDDYMTLDCRVETSGDLASLTKFIYDIESGPLAVRLNTVEISAHDNTGQQLTLGVNVNGLALIAHDKP